jgi:LDH2 family malate/lactate/ureidoglycolate dehydrogenase
MASTLEISKVTVPYDELSEIGVKALELVGVPTEDAKTTVEILLYADLRGIETHGIQRLLMYIPRIRKGLITPKPDIRIHALSPVMRIVDGDDGLGQVVATRGMREAISLAKEWGAAFVGCKNSNHFGAAAPFVEMACDERMIAIVATNAFPSMAPWGGVKNMVGNNPFAVGAPCEGDPPFILDIALSVSSRGRVRQIANRKERIPEGWALDSKGIPTTDPLEALKGFVLPIGGHKGYGLALAVDIISGVLTGAGFADGVKSLLQQWEEPQHIGHSIFVIDPTRFMPWEQFADRMKQLRQSMRSVPALNPKEPVLTPWEPEARIEKERRLEGIPIQDSAFELLQGLTRGQYEYEMPKF